METPFKTQHWGVRSTSYWITLILALGIIFVGIRFMLLPEPAARDYGIAFSDKQDQPFGYIKGLRDIFSGLALLPLLFMHMRKATAWVFTMAIVVPAGDFIIVGSHNGFGDTQHLFAHAITALVMIINSFLLFRTSNQILKS
jgi:uncharacterized membrane protein